MAGDIADDIVDRMFDDYEYEQEDYDTGPKYFSCKHCKAPVRWAQDGHKWIVVNSNGSFHGTNCGDRVAKPEEFDVLR